MPVDRSIEISLQGVFGQSLLKTSLPMPEGIIGPDGLPAPKRFSVYRNNVLVSLIEALTQNFPSIVAMVGEPYFKALAHVYVEDNPPQSPIMMWYGEAFPNFLQTFEPLAEYPYLSDLARFEWHWLQAYHAADEPVFDATRLNGVSPEELAEMRFEFQSAVMVMQSDWPVVSLAAVNRFGTLDPGSVSLEVGEDLLISRPELDVLVTTLRPAAAGFILDLMGGATLGLAAERASERNAAFDLGAVLTDLFQCGAIKDMR